MIICQRRLSILRCQSMHAWGLLWICSRRQQKGFHADLIENARNALTDVNEATESLVRNMSEVNDKQEQVNQSIARGTVEAGGLLGKVTQIAAAYVGFNTIKEQISGCCKLCI